MTKPVKASRSAITGKFVSKRYSQENPKTTVRETIKKAKKK